MAEALNVQLRETRGKRNARRQRHAGTIPAVLYGHGQEPVSLSLSAEAIDTAVRHGSRLVDLVGDVTEQAFIRELQWDTWGKRVLHVDFSRISAHEKVQVQLAVELRGEAPGVKVGGVVEHLTHEIQIECEATSIPEKLALSINHLELGDSITFADLPLPEGVLVLGDADTVVVQCVEPTETPEEEGAGAGEAEPEVIGRKQEDEEN